MLDEARAHLGMRGAIGAHATHVTVYNADRRVHRHYEHLTTDVQLSALTTNAAGMTVVLWDRQPGRLATTVLLCDASAGKRVNVYLDCKSATAPDKDQRLKLGAIHLAFTMQGCTQTIVESAQRRLTAWATNHIRAQRSVNQHP